jgi:4-hydroxybenzoate polyprenyltransferase
VKAAVIFLLLQCLIGLCVLLRFNIFTIFLGFSSIFVVLLYPFMKRVTFWPQSVLGAAFAWGALMGWAAVFQGLALSPALLYLGAVFWTIGYDTIYAMQDIADDRMIGVKSTARLFGRKLRLAVGLFYAASAVSIFLSLWLAHSGTFAYAGLMFYTLHLGWQVKNIDYDNELRALSLFRSNRDAGLLLFAGLAMAAIF